VFTNLSSKVLADSKRLNHRVVCRRFLVAASTERYLAIFFSRFRPDWIIKLWTSRCCSWDFAFYANLCESYLNSVPREQIKSAGEERFQITFTTF